MWRPTDDIKGWWELSNMVSLREKHLQIKYPCPCTALLNSWFNWYYGKYPATSILYIHSTFCGGDIWVKSCTWLAYLHTSSHKQQPKHMPLTLLLNTFVQSSKICYWYAEYIYIKKKKRQLFNTAAQLTWLRKAKPKMYGISDKSFWSPVTNRHAGRALAFATGTTRRSPHARGWIR